MPKILNHLDLNRNQLQNAVIQPLGTPPGDPSLGLIYFDSTAGVNKLKIYNGSAFVNVGDGCIPTLVDSSVTNAKLANMDESTIKGKVAGSGAGPPTDLSPAQVKTILALSSVTDDAQVKKAATSTNGWIPKWSGTNGNAIIDGYGVEATVGNFTGSNTSLVRADVIKAYVDGIVAASDAMIFKGTLGVGGTISVLPASYSKGDSYKVTTAANYSGYNCKVGDLIIATADRVSGGPAANEWVIIEANLDGAVVGPLATTTIGAVPTWSNTNGTTLGSGLLVQSTLSSDNNYIATSAAIVTALNGKAAASHTHGNLTNDGKVGSTAGLILKTGTSGAVGVLTAGSSGQFLAHNGEWATPPNTIYQHPSVNHIPTGGASGNFLKWSSSGTAQWAAHGLTYTDVGAEPVISSKLTAFNKNYTTTVTDIKMNGTQALGTADTLARADHVHPSDTSRTRKYSANLSASASQTVTHNLGTKDLAVAIREVGSPYGLVIADVGFTTDNTVTVAFATAPSVNQYRITLIG